MKALVVDDSMTMRRIVTKLLNKLGVADTIEASNGEEALRVLGDNMPVDVVLLDWHMPVMDGLACLKRIRSEKVFQRVKVIMCTSEAEKAKVVEALKEGVGGYLIKPISAEALKAKLGP